MPRRSVGTQRSASSRRFRRASEGRCGAPSFRCSGRSSTTRLTHSKSIGIGANDSNGRACITACAPRLPTRWTVRWQSQRRCAHSRPRLLRGGSAAAPSPRKGARDCVGSVSQSLRPLVSGAGHVILVHGGQNSCPISPTGCAGSTSTASALEVAAGSRRRRTECRAACIQLLIINRVVTPEAMHAIWSDSTRFRHSRRPTNRSAASTEESRAAAPPAAWCSIVQTQSFQRPRKTHWRRAATFRGTDS